VKKTEEMIEKIIVAIVGPGQAPKQTYFLRESLRHLVRLAQLEKEADVKRCVALSMGTQENITARKTSRAVTRKLLTTLNSKQGRLDLQSKVTG
jgi:hypothetical protein